MDRRAALACMGLATLFSTPGRAFADGPGKYRCLVSGYVYDPAQGDPESGVAPGTPFEKLPEDWACPECGAIKTDFEPIKE